MPWCDACSEYRSPNSLGGDGTCATCGTFVAAHEDVAVEARAVGESAPWHFWIVVVALAAYLLWRLIDGIAWLLG